MIEHAVRVAQTRINNCACSTNACSADVALVTLDAENKRMQAELTQRDLFAEIREGFAALARADARRWRVVRATHAWDLMNSANNPDTFADRLADEQHYA